MSKKVIVAFSGGADSTTVLYRCIQEFGIKNVQPIYFQYGQRHGPGEKKAVNIICNKLRILSKVLKFDLTQFGRSPLTDPNIPVPLQSEEKQAVTVVPLRNTMFLVNATAYAVVNNFDVIALGPTYEDLGEYPDCRPEYFESIQHSLRLADRHHHLKIYTPYVDTRKKDVICEGLDLRVPYEWTWTCYEGVWDHPCRVCDACKEREVSFLENGMIDPLLLRLGIINRRKND